MCLARNVTDKHHSPRLLEKGIEHESVVNAQHHQNKRNVVDRLPHCHIVTSPRISSCLVLLTVDRVWRRPEEKMQNERNSRNEKKDFRTSDTLQCGVQNGAPADLLMRDGDGMGWDGDGKTILSIQSGVAVLASDRGVQRQLCWMGTRARASCGGSPFKRRLNLRGLHDIQPHSFRQTSSSS